MSGLAVVCSRKGFTLVETIIAAVIIALLLGVLAHATSAFFSGQKKIAERQVCLSLARAEISAIDNDGALPDDGSWERRETLMGKTYTISTEVRTNAAEGFTEVRARASSESVAAQVELTRRYFR